jgi:hypothetical protein
MSNALAALGTVVDWSAPRKKLIWTVDDVIAPGKVTALVADAGGGKSPLANWIALSLAAGRSVFPDRWPVSKAEPVVYLDFETGDLVEERFARMANSAGVDLKELGSDLTLVHCDQVLSEELYEQLEAGIVTNQAKLAIVDTYSAALPGDIDFNSSAFSVHLRNLGVVSKSTGASVMVLLHRNKDGKGGLKSISGHGTAGGAIQTCIELDTVSDDGLIEVKCTRHPRRRWEPFRIRWVDDCAKPDASRFAGVSIDGVPWGLHPELVGAAGDTAMRKRPQVTKAKLEAEAATQAALPRIWKALQEARGPGSHPFQPETLTLRALITVGGEGRGATERALARLVDHGAVQRVDGHFKRAPDWHGVLPFAHSRTDDVPADENA